MNSSGNAKQRRTYKRRVLKKWGDKALITFGKARLTGKAARSPLSYAYEFERKEARRR